jgi:competence protein ComEC
MKKVLVFLAIACLALLSLVAYEYKSSVDGKLHIVFCDVGQGDAIFIKTPNNKYILVDGGPDRSVLHCLDKHMPFWQRKIDLVILTHPHADHFFGMFYVLERYQIGAFATEQLANKTEAYEELLRKLKQQNVPSTFVSSGAQWKLGQTKVAVVGPTQKYLKQTSPGGTIGERKEFASVVIEVSYGTFSALLTGDSQVQGLEDAVPQLHNSIDVLHVPHHGSGSGLDKEILEELQPSLAVVSVGAENRYNHPHPQIMELLQSQQIQSLRTDQKGDIVIESNGQMWRVR